MAVPVRRKIMKRRTWKQFNPAPICPTCNRACLVACTIQDGARTYQKRYCPVCRRRMTTEYS